MQLHLKKDDFHINLFDENSCVVNLSLLNPIGRIMRVTPNFEKIFGMKFN